MNQELGKTLGVVTLFTYLEVILTVYLIGDTYFELFLLLFLGYQLVIVSFLVFIQYFRFYHLSLQFLFPAAYTLQSIPTP